MAETTSTTMLDLNTHCGGSAGPNAWENPTLSGINRLPPHSKNIRHMAETFYSYNNLLLKRGSSISEKEQRIHPTGPHPCICLDSDKSGCDGRHSLTYIFQPRDFPDDDPSVRILSFICAAFMCMLILHYYSIVSSFLLSQNTLEEPYANTIKEMRASESYQSKSTVLQTNNGWQFRLFPNPKSIPKTYILPTPTTAADISFCNKQISIPSNWTMEDHTNCCCDVHDPPRYTNVQMPFDTLYPHVPEDNPTGVYRLQFSKLPLGWMDSEQNGTQIKRRVVLHLGGVESCFFVYMNGNFVGMGKDSRLPSEFDVTDYIKHYKENDEQAEETETEENVLAIVVLKWCDGSFLEQQDHWRGMAGIHRSMFLYSTPADAYIEDVFCQAEITNLKEEMERKTFPPQYKGLLKIKARIGRDNNTRVEGRNIYYNEQIECARANDVTYRLMFQLYDKNWKPIFDERVDPTYEGNTLVTDAHFRSGLVEFRVEVPGNILAWSDESPFLYRLQATLVQINPASANLTCDVDVFNCKIGFRDIKIADRELLINGQPVLIKGVNRHDHSSTRGKAVSLDEIRSDLQMMKQYNFNAVRTAHYPNDAYLYEIADKLGLYVIDEANIECHGHYDMICREHTFAAAMLDRTQRMVIRDQNHPSIIGWSLGNEAGYSMNHKMLYGWIKGYDSSRFVQYEGANRPVWGQLPHVYERTDSAQGSDIICPMYPTIHEMIDWADNIAPRINEERPFIMCEYAHAMGNSSGSLSDYWKAIKEKDGLQGGFIWDWKDQGLQQKTEAANAWEVKVWHKYGGDYGDMPTDNNFNINGMCGPDGQAHPAMHEHKKCVQPVDFELKTERNDDGQLSFTVQVRNGKYFTTLDGVLTWDLKVGGFTQEKGTCPIPANTLPQKSVDIPIPEIKMGTEFIEIAGDAEIHLDVGVTTREDYDSPFAYEYLAMEQFSVTEHLSKELMSNTEAPQYLSYMFNSSNSPLPHVVQGDGYVELSSIGSSMEIMDCVQNYYNVKFKKESVQFEYWSGSEKLVYDMVPNLFRAPTDNDAVKQHGNQASDDSKPLGRWLRLGLDCISLEDVEIATTTEELGNKGVVTKATMYGLPGKNAYHGIALAEKVAADLQGKDQQPVKLGTWQQRVTMHCNGCLFVETTMELEESLKDLPRVGVQLSVPGKMSSGISFADGPWENYPDRRLAAHAGVVRRPFLADPTTYCVPQEQGSRMNLRWLLLAESDDSKPSSKVAKRTPRSDLDNVLDGKKGVLIVSSGKLPQYTVSRCTDLSIFRARHVHEVEVSKDTVYIRLDAAQRGLGTGSCGPQTLPEYRVNGGTFEINFWIKPIEGKE